MQIEAQKRTLAEVLQVGQHVIPRYQRRYAWEAHNIRDFWNDIQAANGQHFLGSMVTSGVSSAPREVIDGQQRLTTVIISLCALRDVYQEKGYHERVTGIDAFLAFNDRNGHKTYRLKNADKAAADKLSDYVLIDKLSPNRKTDSNAESLEAGAYSLFRELLEDEIADSGNEIAILDSVRDRILESEIVYINVESRKNAFTIFETLNDRGRSLTVMDLVKNHVFAEIEASDEDSTERAWSTTLDILSELQQESMSADSFLYYSWNSRFQGNQKKVDTIETARLRRSIVDSMQNQDHLETAARNFVNGLHEDARLISTFDQILMDNGAPQAWRAFDKNWRRDKYDEIDDHLYGILVTGSKQPIPLLLALMRSYFQESHRISRKLLIKFLKAVESFQFRWSIAQKPSTSTIRRNYRLAASAVAEATDSVSYNAALAGFVDSMKGIDATDIQFQNGITRLAYSRGRSKDVFKIRHLLTRIEKSYGSTKLDLTKQCSIEHLLGQEGRSEATPRNSWIFKVGNLALLPPGVNSTLPRTFEDKGSILSDWVNDEDDVLVSAIGESKWDNKKANVRMEAICQRAFRIWPKAENAAV